MKRDGIKTVVAILRDAEARMRRRDSRLEETAKRFVLGLRELAHAKAIEGTVNGTASASVGEVVMAALVDMRRKRGKGK